MLPKLWAWRLHQREPSVVFHINRTFRRDRLEAGLTDSIWPYGKPLKARLPRRLKRLLLVQTLER
jgi:hypothetical protein